MRFIVDLVKFCRERLGLGTVLFLLLALGILFLVLGHFVLPDYGESVLHDWSPLAEELSKSFGEALIVAAVLGLTVDLSLKGELARDTARDAFRAGFGYILPEELKPELHWLYSQKIVAREHHHTFTLKPQGEDLMTLEVYLDRELENVSNGLYSLPITFELDRWNAGEDAEILEMGCSTPNGHFDDKYFGPIEPGEHTITGKLQTVKLGPREKCRLWYRGKETRRRNGEFYHILLNATTKPMVEVNVDACGPDIRYELEFLNWNADKCEGIGGNKKQFHGTLLPYQGIRLRWWEIPMATCETQPPPKSKLAATAVKMLHSAQQSLSDNRRG